jgi:hypothetical protein
LKKIAQLYGFELTPWCISPEVDYEDKKPGKYSKKLFLGMPVGTRRGYLMKKTVIKI